MDFFAQFFLKPRLTIITILVVLVGAFAAIGTLGRQEDPTLIERFGTVQVTLPGADAEQVESQLAEPIEAVLLELPEIDKLTSFSGTGRLQLSIDILENLSETQVEEAWTKIRAQLDTVRSSLPDEIDTYTLERIYVGAHTLVVNLEWRGKAGDVPLNIMARKAQELTQRLRNLPGTEFVENFGLPSEEVRIIPDIDQLAALGLSLGQFAGIITQSDTRRPAGRLRTGTGNITLEVSGEIDSLSRLAELPIIATPSGNILQLRDIARIERGVETPARVMAMRNGKQSIMVGAGISPGLRVDLWAAEAHNILTEFEATLPESITVEVLFDQNVYTSGRLAGLTRNLGFSALIVFFVVWASMGIRGAIVVGSALPLTVGCVLCVFLLTGKTLHQMSITGLVIALGLLIDNAIVVVDEYDQMRDRGIPPLESIKRVLRFLFAPLGASTLTTVLAFLPIAILPGPSGEFVGMIGFSVIAAVTSSFLIALTIIPALSGWLDKGDSSHSQEKLWWRDGFTFPIIGEGYRLFLEKALRMPLITVASCLLLVGGGFYCSTLLPSQFFPATERNQLEVLIDLPDDTSLMQTWDVSNRAMDILLAQNGVVDAYLVAGEPAPRVYYNAMNLGEGFENRSAGWVEFSDAKTARQSAQKLQDLMTESFPTATVRVTPFTQGPPIGAPIEVIVYGEDLAVLNAIGRQIRLILADTPGVTYSEADLALGAPILSFEAREADKAIIGRSGLDLVQQLNTETQGIEVTTIQEGYQQIPVIVKTPRTRRTNLDALFDGTIQGRGDGSNGTPLADLGRTSLKAKTVSIPRQQGKRVNVISGFLDPYHLPAPALAVFKEKLEAANLEIPVGYEITYGGEEEASGDTNSSLAALAGPIFLIMLGGIALVFNSFRMAGIIMLSGVLSMGFAFGAIAFFNLPLGFNAIIGILSLLGIAINGSIVVAALLQADDRAKAGDIDQQAFIVTKATRHIVATTFTTIGGFVPLLIQGDSFWMPFAAAIAGGAAGSALLALVFTPAMMSFFIANGSRKGRANMMMTHQHQTTPTTTLG